MLGLKRTGGTRLRVSTNFMKPENSGMLPSISAYTVTWWQQLVVRAGLKSMGVCCVVVSDLSYLIRKTLRGEAALKGWRLLVHLLALI